MEPLLKEEKVRTLGMYEPYASLMLCGKIETRWVLKGRKPPFPLGYYLLYATKHSSVCDFLLTSGVYAKSACEILEGKIVGENRPVCVGELINVRLYNISDGPLTFVDSMDGLMYSTKDAVVSTYVLWCLEFINIKPINSFDFKGKQGVGILSMEEKSKIIFK